MISLATLKAVSANTAKLREFVETGALQKAIQEMGGIQFEAAAMALSNMSIATDPAREVAAAITHLQAAHIAFQKLHSGRAYVSQATFLTAAGKDVISCCIMAICYRYLDERALMERVLSDATAAAEQLTFWSGLKFTVTRPVHSWKRGVGMFFSPIESVKAHRFLDYDPAAVRSFARALSA